MDAVEIAVQWNFIVECAHKAKLDMEENDRLRACIKGIGEDLKSSVASDIKTAERAALDKAKEPEDKELFGNVVDWEAKELGD